MTPTPAVEVGQTASGRPATAPSESSVSPSEAVWTLLSAPYAPVEATRSLFGLSPEAARYVVARELLISAEAEGLLDAMPDIIRHMRNQLGFEEVRSVGAVTGPIQWHSTITARASAGNPDDLFMCAAPFRDFNVPENQLLAHTLRQLVRSGQHVSAFARDSFDDERNALAREQARRAGRYLDVRSFNDVKPKSDPLTIRRTRRTKAKSTYEPLLALLPRINRPLSSWAITHLGDRRTSQQHKVLLAVLATLRREGVDVFPFRPRDGVLTAGPVEYRHPGARGAAGAHGIRVGRLLLDVPDVPGDHEGAVRRLGQRSGSLTPHVVGSVADVAELKETLVDAAS